MSESIEFNFVPFGDENQTETLFREYIEELLARLDMGRVGSSCARERAVLQLVCGAFQTPRDTHVDFDWHELRSMMFDQFKEAFGWSGDEVELLKWWMGLGPILSECVSYEEWKSRCREVQELFEADPYSRHEAFWARCRECGYQSFMAWWGYRNAEHLSAAVTLIDEAAKALGDE